MVAERAAAVAAADSWAVVSDIVDSICLFVLASSCEFTVFDFMALKRFNFPFEEMVRQINGL